MEILFVFRARKGVGKQKDCNEEPDPCGGKCGCEGHAPNKKSVEKSTLFIF